MQITDLKVNFSEMLSNINFDGDFVAEIKREMASKSDEIRIPDEFLSPQVLPFHICSKDYILSNFDKLKPISKEDAMLKFYAYVYHTLDISSDVFNLFDGYRNVFHFRYYNSVKIGNETRNALQIFLLDNLTEEDNIGNSPEIYRALEHLFNLVDLSEKDCYNNSSLDYIRNCKQSASLEELSQIVLRHQRTIDIIEVLHNSIWTQHESTKMLSFDETYSSALTLLRNYLKLPFYKYLTKLLDIQIDLDQLTMTINRIYKISEKISLDGFIIHDIKRYIKSKPDESSLIHKLLLRPNVLKYALWNDKYIINHYHEIKPSSKEDANMKLYFYTSYNSHLNLDILRLFAKVQQEYNFRFYGNIPIFGELLNPLHVYLRKHLVPEKTQTFTEENFKALYVLMTLVDLNERDFEDRRAVFYIREAHRDIREKLVNMARKSHAYQLILDLISEIEHAISKGLSSMPLDCKYLRIIRELPKIEKFNKIARLYHFRVHEEPGNNILRIKPIKPQISPIPYA